MFKFGQHFYSSLMFLKKAAALPSEAPIACIIKLFTAIMNAVACQASVYVIVGHFFLALTNTLAYYGRELITTVKSYMIQSPMSLTLHSLLT